jgi:hypothetical protein
MPRTWFYVGLQLVGMGFLLIKLMIRTRLLWKSTMNQIETGGRGGAKGLQYRPLRLVAAVARARMKTRVIRLSGVGMLLTLLLGMLLLKLGTVPLLLGTRMLLLNQGMTRRLEARDVSISAAGTRMLLLNQGMTRRLEARDVSITRTWNRMLQIAARAGLSRSVALQRLDNLKLQKELSMRHPGTRRRISAERIRLCRPVPLQRQLLKLLLHQQRQHILTMLSPYVQQQQ